MLENLSVLKLYFGMEWTEGSSPDPAVLFPLRLTRCSGPWALALACTAGPSP